MCGLSSLCFFHIKGHRGGFNHTMMNSIKTYAWNQRWRHPTLANHTQPKYLNGIQLMNLFISNLPTILSHIIEGSMDLLFFANFDLSLQIRHWIRLCLIWFYISQQTYVVWTRSVSREPMRFSNFYHTFIFVWRWTRLIFYLHQRGYISKRLHSLSFQW